MTDGNRANDVYVIDSKEHGEVLMPAIKECVLNVDMENKSLLFI